MMQAGQIRKQASPKDKRGISFFCKNFCGWQYETADGKCPKCGVKVIRESTYQAAAKRFEIIISENRKAIDHHIPIMSPEEKSIKIPFQLGKQTYFVPLKWFVEFDTIRNTDKEERPLHIQLEMFFDAVKQSCKSYQF